jgi:hypothetical protein
MFRGKASGSMVLMAIDTSAEGESLASEEWVALNNIKIDPKDTLMICW